MMQYFVSLLTSGSFQWQLSNSKWRCGEFPIDWDAEETWSCEEPAVFFLLPIHSSIVC